jgi:glucosamine 6-phosphate synthetase-like amidotransferase/phosphosugar isomerase protein
VDSIFTEGIFGIVTDKEQPLGSIPIEASRRLTYRSCDSVGAPILPLQMLSYSMPVARGYDPDFPRNLSKTLIVD